MNAETAALYALAESRLPDALAWLKRLVAVNSLTTHAAGVDEVARLTAECFAHLGFAAEFIKAEHPDYGHHLLLRRDGAEPNHPPIVLVTHSDTVFSAEEEQQNQFEWKEQADGRIVGPGVVDNKGGTILIWLMLSAFREVWPEAFASTSWLIAANAAEEVIGSDFAEQVKARCPDGAKAVLVFEGQPWDESKWPLVTSRKGRAECRVTVEGRAAHAGSQFEQGINAVVELSKLVPKMAALSNRERQLTVNVAHIQGGTVLNRVPHEAFLELEMRAFSPKVLEEALSELFKLEGVTESGALVRVECFGQTRAWPGGEATEELFKLWVNASDEIGHSLISMARGGLSDANYLSELGPVLDALGPIGGHAHCSESLASEGKYPEFVEPASFVPKAVLNALGLASLLALRKAS